MRCVDDQTLLRMSLGLLSPEEAKVVREHAESCPSCGRRVSEVSEGKATLKEVQDTLALGSPPVDPDLLKSGEKLGRYLVLQQLGTGGMGAVYAAYDPQLDRKIALKVLRGQFAEAEEGQARARLLREAQAIARISHPNVVNVFDVGIAESRVFVAMEFVDGGTLRQWLKQRARSWKEIVEIYREAARGLAAAHQAGLVHRDFKPDNVLVGKEGRVRVTDFGLARLSGSAENYNPASISPENLASDTSRHLSSEVTQHGTILGTTAYMAPEQFQGAPPDIRSDQFAFCVSLYESLYGERPYPAQQLASNPHSAALPPQPTNVRLPKRIYRAIARGLSIKPEQRFASMIELIRALHLEPRNRNRATVVVAALCLVSVIGWPLYHFEQQQRQLCRGAESKLSSAWGDSQRQATGAAFLATQLPYAVDAYRVVSRRLDDYARDWVAMETEACEATRLRGDQSDEMLDLRISCLSRRREELKALAGVFASADRSVVENAVAAVQQLSPIEDCAKVDLLKLPVRPPADAVGKAKVEEARLKLSRVKAFNDAGKYGEALLLAKQTASEVEQIPYRPLEAEALWALGDSLRRSGHFEESERLFIKAALAAEVSRHDEVVAQARIGLVYTSKDLMKAEEMELWANFAFAAIDRIGGNDRLLWVVENVLGIDCRRREKYDEALAHYRRAVAIIERIKDTRALETVTNNIGVVLMRQGKYDEALPYFERSLSLTEKTLGATHPDVGATLSNIGTLMMFRDRYDEAHAYFRRSLEIKQRSYRTEHPSLAVDYGRVGDVLLLEHKYDEAVHWYERALAIDETALGPNHPQVASELVGVANARLGLGRPDLATSLLKKALTILGSEYKGTTFLADVKFAYARAQLELRRDPKKAKEWAVEAREAFSKVGSTERKQLEVEEWLARNFPHR